MTKRHKQYVIVARPPLSLAKSHVIGPKTGFENVLLYFEARRQEIMQRKVMSATVLHLHIDPPSD